MSTGILVRGTYRITGLAIALALAACGGDGAATPTDGAGSAAAGAGGTGTVQFRVAWPERDAPPESRAIPDAATAVVIFIEGGNLEQTLRVDIPRPDSFYSTVSDRRITLAEGDYTFTGHAAVGLPDTVLPNPSVAFGFEQEYIYADRINEVGIELRPYLRLTSIRSSSEPEPYPPDWRPPLDPPYPAHTHNPYVVVHNGAELGIRGYSAFYTTRARVLRPGEPLVLEETGPYDGEDRDDLLDGVSVEGIDDSYFDPRSSHGQLGQIHYHLRPTSSWVGNGYHEDPVPPEWSVTLRVEYRSSLIGLSQIGTPLVRTFAATASTVDDGTGAPREVWHLPSSATPVPLYQPGVQHSLTPAEAMALGDSAWVEHNWEFEGTGVRGTTRWTWETTFDVEMPLTPVRLSTD